MDLVIIVILLAIVVFWFKTFNSFIYFMALTDIFFRIMTFIKLNIGVKAIADFIGKYIPESILAVLNNYSSGILNIILVWCYLICYIIFEIYIIKTFFHKK